MGAWAIVGAPHVGGRECRAVSRLDGGWGVEGGRGWRNGVSADVVPLLPPFPLGPLCCRYPVHVWWDGPGQRVKVDVYGGLDSSGFDASTVRE